MKKIKLLLIAFLAMSMTANVFGQYNPTVPSTDNPDERTHVTPQIVAPGSAYTYSVHLNTTSDLKKLLGQTGGEERNNLYSWEVFEVDAAGNKVGTPIAIYTKTQELGVNSQKVEWSDANFTGLAKDKMYVVRITEYPNHGGEAPDVDKSDCVAAVSEILVKIGDDVIIDIINGDGDLDPNGKENFYACNSDIAELSDLDDKAGKIKLRFNGRPKADIDGNGTNGWIVKYKVGDKAGVTTEVTKYIAYADVQSSLDEEGYYRTEIGIADIIADLSVDAASEDIYYTVSIVKFEDADKTQTIENTQRIYGIYTTPKVTKINFK